MKIKKIYIFWGGVGLGGQVRRSQVRRVRVDVNEELKFLRKFTKKMRGGGVHRCLGWRGLGGCERRIEVYVKIQKKKYFFFWGGGGRVGLVGMGVGF